MNRHVLKKMNQTTANATTKQASEHFDVLIVGAGISGIGSAYHVTKQLPGSSYVILETQATFGGTSRVAALVATGQPGTLQIRLVDPVTNGVRDGIGACTGDSGGPVFEDRPNGAVLVGVISWSTGPNGAAGCGGLTGVTPLTLYRDWILQTARSWGAAL